MISKDSQGGLKKSLTSIIKEELIENVGPFLLGRSLNVFKATNPVRKLVFNIVTHNRFDMFIILVIIVSAV